MFTVNESHHCSAAIPLSKYLFGMKVRRRWWGRRKAVAKWNMRKTTERFFFPPFGNKVPCCDSVDGSFSSADAVSVSLRLGKTRLDLFDK